MTNPLTPEQEERFREVASDLYNGCGYDLGWVEDTPDDEEFVDVIRDLMAGSSELTSAEQKLWSSLPYEIKQRIILAVGP